VITTARKGWCPSLFEPMRSGDGWLTRVKPPRALLTSAGARALSEAAMRFGNGTEELTSRGNLQIRGLSPKGFAPFAEAIIAAGLAHPNPAIERRRAVIHPPLASMEPELAPEIEAILAGDPALASLPAKFCAAVDSSPVLPLGPTFADLTVIMTGTGALLLPAGSRLAARVAPTETAAAVRLIALSFLALSAQCSPAPRRMRALIRTIGAERLFAAAGLVACQPAETRPMVEAVGWLPFPDNDIGVVGLGIPSGAMTAATLMSLADLAERYGDGEIRLTPWRTVLLPNIAEHDREVVQAAALILGLIVDPADPRRAIVTCIGQPGCASASIDVRGDAALLRRRDLPRPIHVSGCAKGCAHHGVMPITLVGESGRYDVVFDGTTRDAPSLRALTMRQVIEALRRRR
jgi:precorrin-3B synthase